MWTVIYMAQDKETAHRLDEILTKEGFLIKLRKIAKSSKTNQIFYEILVPRSEAEDAHKILLENLTF